jgi:serine/threonine protein kinase
MPSPCPSPVRGGTQALLLPLFLKGGADVIFRFCFCFLCAAPPSPAGSRYLEDFEEIEKIGTGSFSEVFKARNRVDGWLYAVKQAKRAFSSPADMHNTLKEVYALAALGSHPHVVRYYSAWVEDRLYIQTGKRNATHHTAPRRLMMMVMVL